MSLLHQINKVSLTFRSVIFGTIDALFKPITTGQLTKSNGHWEFDAGHHVSNQIFLDTALTSPVDCTVNVKSIGKLLKNGPFPLKINQILWFVTI